MDLQQSITNQTDVSLTITESVLSSDEAKKTNLVISPLSLHVVLSLITAGASGSALDQLLSFLKSLSSNNLNKLCSEIVAHVFADGTAVGGPKLNYANGVWVDQTLPLLPNFKHVIDHLYKAESNPVDFVNNASVVVTDVNSWAEKHTNGLIKDLLSIDSVDSTTRLIFANAIYFKGAWNEKFDASITKEGDFFLLNGDSVKVPFMTSYKDQYIKTFDDFKVLRLPYKQGEDKRQFSMYFFLPNAKDGLSNLVQKVCSEDGFVNKNLLHFEKVLVGDFRLPKFKISFEFKAAEVLKNLGVELPFLGGGLMKVTDSYEAKNLCVSSIFQKSFIEINEEGTEAAAATAVQVSVQCLMIPKVLDFVADHPFMFLIREDITGAVLFTGHIMNPFLC